jgi:hypothetical protein
MAVDPARAKSLFLAASDLVDPAERLGRSLTRRAANKAGPASMNPITPTRNTTANCAWADQADGDQARCVSGGRRRVVPQAAAPGIEGRE